MIIKNHWMIQSPSKVKFNTYVAYSESGSDLLRFHSISITSLFEISFIKNYVIRDRNKDYNVLKLVSCLTMIGQYVNHVLNSPS